MCARSTRWLVQTALCAACTAWGGAQLVAEQPSPSDENPLVGTWRLVVEKSRYNPGPPPQRQMRTYQAQPNGVKTIIRTVQADGESTTVEYTANYDSIEYRVTGSAAADGIALTRIDAHTAEAKLMHAGRVVGTARRVVSADGKTMTITLRDARGAVQNVAFYEKEGS
jgi:histidinol dehydrogenase